MGRLGVAFRAFFRALANDDFCRRVDAILKGKTPVPDASATSAPVGKAAPPPKPARGEALTLLATLQREARLVDFLKESLAEFSDAQIGAAVRDIHRDCAAAVDRVFGIQPLSDLPEGAALDLPAGFDAARHRLTGNVGGQPPYRGRVTHHGWQATRVELAEWNGSPEAARIVAPIEVDIA